MRKIAGFVILFLLIPSRLPSQTAPYWHTVHIANWDHGFEPASAIPWQNITHMIHFSGGSLGRQTHASAPGYFEAPSNYEDSYSQQLHTLAKANNVKFLVDLGLNAGNGFSNVCALGIPAMQTWASTVAHYIVKYDYDGADFDCEGGSYPANGGMGKMAQLLHDTLSVLSPGRKYYITTSMMPNSGDVTGYGVAAYISYFDQVNDMWYDQGFPVGAPLYQSTAHPCWSTDSAVAAAYERVGVPKSKIGLGYPIQVYDGCAKCYAYLNQMMQYFPGSTVYWDDQAKARWFTGNGHTVAYDDTLTGAYKADFIKRKGYGGIMGFSLTYGYVANPPAGWSHNPAADGIGKYLLHSGGPPPPPPVDSVKPVVTLLSPLNGDSVSSVAVLSAQASDNVGVAKVEFLVDGAVVGTVFSAPYSYSWNVASVTGAHTISARASDAAGNTATTPAVTVVVIPPPPIPPLTPVLTSPPNGASGQPATLNLAWNAVGGATSYRVQVSTSSGFSPLVLDDSAVTPASRQVGPLSLGTIYYWRVSARNSYGLSAYSNVWSFTTVLPPPPDTIPNPAVVRDDFNRPNGVVVGTQKWAPIVNQPLNGSMVVFDSMITPRVDTGFYNFGGVAWDTLMGAGTEASVVLKQKGGNTAWTSLFIYARMNNKDYNTGTGYRLRYFEQSGTDMLEIHRVGPGYAVSAVLASTYLEVNPGDKITFRVLTDNWTMVGLVNGVKVITAVDSVYKPGQWYFALRGCVFPTPVLYDNFGVSSVTSSAFGTPYLISPANGALGQQTSPLLTWSPVAGATSYRVQVASDLNFQTLVLDDSSVVGTTRQAGPLSNNATYYWRVRASYSGGTGPYCPTWSFTTTAAAPATPALASPVAGSVNQPTTLTVSWNASATAATYRVQVSADSLFGTTVLDDSTVTGTSRQVGALSKSAIYYWRVNAKNAGGTSAYSAAWNFTTTAGPPPAPVLASPANGAVNQPATLVLGWNPSPGASSYRVQAAADSLFGTIVLDDSAVAGTSRQAGPLSPSTKYYWRVRASNNSGTSAYTGPWNFSIASGPLPPPGTPILLSPADGATGQPRSLTLSWAQSGGATSYRVQLSVDSLFSSTVLDDSTLTAQSRAVASLPVYTLFYWRVSARNDSGVSPYSARWAFRTKVDSSIITMSRSSISFGRLRVGTTKRDSIFVGNSENYALNVSTIQSSTSQFVVSPSALTIPPASNRRFYVTFAPTQRSNIQGKIMVRLDSLGVSSSVSVSGKGIYPPTFSPNPDNVVLNSGPLAGPAVDSFYVTNTGDDTLTISGIRSTNRHFSISPTTASIASAESLGFRVSATPPSNLNKATTSFIVSSNSATGSDTVTAEISSVSGVIPGEVPTEYSLSQNYPNPFNPTTQIQYELPGPSRVILKIYDVVGEEVVTLVNETEGAGIRAVTWNAMDKRGQAVPSGVYYYRVDAINMTDLNKSFIEVKKMILLK